MKISEAYAKHDLILVNQDATEKTRSNYRASFYSKNGLSRIIGDAHVTDLTLDHILNWKLHMRMEGLKPSYINLNLLFLKAVLKTAAYDLEGMLDITKISFDKKEQAAPHTTLSNAEVKSMVSVATNLRDKALIHLFYSTACRSAEIINLDRRDWEAAELVNHEKKVWCIWVVGKNKKHRPVYFYQETKDMVDAYLDSRTDCYRPLFISNQNRRVHYDTVNKMFHRVSRLAGLEKHVTQHVMRHTRITDLAASGMPLPTIAYTAGHKDSTITQRIYTHINQKHSIDAYANFASALQVAS